MAELANELELISDGDGLAVIGEPSAVERFMSSVGLSAESGPGHRAASFRTASSVLQKESEIAADSGRWVKLTEDSAAKVRQFGLTDTKTPGMKHAMVGQPGDIKSWIQIVKTPSSMVTNPAILAGAAGIMAQLAMQSQMDEITDYLAQIDAKLDDVLRAQTNQVLARLDGVALAVREAMSVRDAVGRVSDITWSKVQGSSHAIAETQGYALRQLGDLADKLEKQSSIGALVDVTEEAEKDVQKWLVVLARCFELQDAVAVIELDRVLDESPDELDRHRVGLTSARQDRLELIASKTDLILSRMDAAAELANAKVLFNPLQSPAVVRSSNQVASGVHEFHRLLGIESGLESSETRQWTEAAADTWDAASATGAQGIDAVRQLGSKAGGHAKSVTGRLTGRFASRKSRGADSGGEEPGA